jgi:hypothetical protein
VTIASNIGSKQALEAVKTHLPELCRPPFVYALSKEQVVAIAGNGGGKQALLAVKEQLGELRGRPYGLTTAQVVAIASRIGGKQALDAVKEHLLELCSPPFIYALSKEQVVAIASNGGGRQALLAVREQVADLRGEPYGLTTAQVVAIASHIGGKQALDAVKEHLLELCAPPYCLRKDQVVAIASNEGGRQALSAVKLHLPRLLGAPFELARDHVVDVACLGGRVAVEAMVEHPPGLRERYDTDRLLTIVCLGGGEALRALRQGLPWAATRPTGRRTIVERRSTSAAASMPGARELTTILMFFSMHGNPPQAFAEARDKFGMSTQALVRLMARAGVTEVEAIGGTIPHASERWRRLLSALGSRFTSGSIAPPSPRSPPALEGFADSLERALMSPSPARELPTAQAAKRPAGTAGATSSKRPRVDAAARTPRLEAASPANLRWGQQARRTQRRVTLEPQLQAALAAVASPPPEDAADFGLPDPGLTGEDLAWLTQLFG